MTATLLEVLRAPDRLGRLGPADWDELLRLARHHRLLGRLAAELAAHGAEGSHPVVLDVLAAARRRAAAEQTRMRFEIDRLGRALAPLPGPRVLMKGGAYLLAGLPPARGRISSDVDVLLPRDQLAEAERLLRRSGWDPVYEDAYTQHYYRDWMHELPPLRHRHRHAYVDLHHTILPLTHRFRPDGAALIAAAVPIGDSGWSMLAPADMVLNVVAHLFADGDFADALREVVDLHDLLTAFGREPGFWDELARRAELHGLARPLGDALWVTRALLETPMPPQPWAPRPVRRLMLAALTPRPPGDASAALRAVRLALYMRSHWLRMPPVMLARHLAIKAWRRLRPAQPLAASRDST